MGNRKDSQDAFPQYRQQIDCVQKQNKHKNNRE